MLEKNRHSAYCRLLDVEIAACMREFSELKVKQAAKTALSSNVAGGNDTSDEEDLSRYDKDIDEYLLTEREIEALENASVNEKHIKDQTDVRKPKTKRQRYDEHIEFEFLITHDIEDCGYVLSREIANSDDSIIRAYVKEFKETYRDVVSEIFLRVKEGNYPEITWTKETTNTPYALPRLRIEDVVDSRFQMVNKLDTWKKLKKKCIYNPPCA